jgi:hypothetical protein
MKNEYPNIEKKTFVKKLPKTQIKKFISKLDLGLSSKEGLYFLAARWLEINEPNNTMIQDFKNAGHQILTRRSNQEKENELDEKDIENYKEYDYFKTILDKINFSEITNKKTYYESMLLALLILQPPLRTYVYTSCIIQNATKTNDKDNYLILTYKLGTIRRAYFYINKDKVSGSKSYSDEFKKQIEITDRNLINILFDGYEKFPRKTLFENKDGGMIKSETLLRYLRTVSKVEQINIDMMRSSYITHQYNKGITYKQKEDLSLAMRHSVQAAASTFYYKILDKNPKPRDEEMLKLKEDNNKLQAEINELKSKLGTFEPSDKLYQKRRSDVIFRLKNGQTLKQSTIDKYKITEEELKQIEKKLILIS